MTLELVAILGVLLVVAVTAIAPRVGVAAPLLLVGLGLALAFLPFVDQVSVPPEWILGGVLPPLLYSAAVSTPTMEFRRDFRLISAFSVILIVVSAVSIGFLATALVPGLPPGIGIALGAIISPTDAVATSIVRQAGVSTRVVTVLEGESLLNDASALVLLRSAVAAVGVSVSLWDVALNFLWAVGAAAAIGWAVAKLNLLIRSRITQVTSNVTLSLVVPFIAYLPAEHVGASGLVAAVTAGLITGYGAPRRLGAEVRMTERAVWRTIELLLESAVFLLVGLEVPTLVEDVVDQGGGLGVAALVAVATATLAIAVRAGFVAWSVWTLSRRARRTPAVRQRLTRMQEELSGGRVHRTDGLAHPSRKDRQVRRAAQRAGANAGPYAARLGRWQDLLSKRLADVDYLAAEQFGWRDGMILVWAGMRGAVTIAAAQTLPSGTPHRSLLVLAATLVAVGTLIVQGSTLGWLASRLGVTASSETDPEQWEALQADLRRAALDHLSGRLDGYPADLAERMRDRLARLPGSNDDDDFRPGSAATRARAGAYRALRLALIDAQRSELLAIRDLGTYPSDMMNAALSRLDAEQIGIELHRA